MTVAFYAPLKAPNHTVPSGDRTMARALMAAMQATGRAVDLASELRLYDGVGLPETQDALLAAARAETARLLATPQARTWRVWVTYHNYYKAPDLIGPAVCDALALPYVQIESTRARKRLQGPWAQFAQAAEDASDAAALIFYLTHRDAETLRRDAPAAQVLRHLPPFLQQDALPEASTLDGPMLSVGMMREGDKLASYRLIAETLRTLPAGMDWRLDIAGDGTARHEVEALMAPFGNRVRLLGQLNSAALADLYKQASILFWPGVNEAFGLTYLEAQAAGVPVVAQNRPGVCDVVVGPQSDVNAGAQAMADHLANLLGDQGARRAAGKAARDTVGARHLLGHAARTIDTELRGLT
ncbi:glycosyltransferase [uncultured Tateyamaria sp.]|uniref:glycosyltransferase n=1 Tax=uncultured Tateyamaria sp. TaxID=455651 RepID=UPI002614CDFC|nr:glycosyltransferase [uncultured Tateyamaria sp.]